jgi:hypothetical protein
VFTVLFRQGIRKKWFALLLPLVGLFSVTRVLVAPADAASAGVNLGGALWMLGLGVFFFVGLPYLQTRAVMKNPNFGQPTSLRISEGGIEFAGKHSNAKIGWPMVMGVSESTNAILIQLKAAGIHIIPSSQLSESDLLAVRTVLRQCAPGNVRLRQK